jgi:peptidoglycan/LPS O-acetylase OafA/YrhL
LRVPARHISIASLAIAAGSILLLFHASPQYINTAQDFGFVRCCAGFFAGVLCYRRVALSAASPPPSSLTGTMLEVATIAGVLHFLAEIGPTPSSLVAPLFFSLAVGVFALERGAISAALRHRLFQALGAWSYSIYMLQLPVFMLIYFAWRMNEKLGGAISEATATTRLHEIAGTAGLSRLLLDAPALGLLAVIILTARLSYRYVELPCQAALRSMFAGAIR